MMNAIELGLAKNLLVVLIGTSEKHECIVASSVLQRPFEYLISWILLDRGELKV